MPRVLKNTLIEAEMLETLIGSIDAAEYAAMERYGADLLGRAIGHEQAHERAKGLPPTMFYSNLVYETDHTPSRKILAFDAAREVMAL